MNAFFIGMGVLVLLIVVIFVAPGVYALIQRMRPQPVAQPAQAGGGAAQPAGAGHGGGNTLRNPLIWVGVLVALVLWFTMDRNLLLGAGVLVALAVLAFMGKGGVWAKVGLGVLALSFLLFGARSPEVLEKVQEGAAGVVLDGKSVMPDVKLPDITNVPSGPSGLGKKVQQGPTTTKNLVTWEGHEVGTEIPTNVWSKETVETPFGCTADFPNRAGIRIRYRDYSPKWHDLASASGPRPSASHHQVMVTEPGITEVPYVFKCS